VSLEQAIDLLRRGEAGAARQLLDKMVAAGADGFALQLGLGYACAAVGDASAALQAANAALAHDPREPRALLLKADLLHHRGDPQASGFYGAALRVAAALDPAQPDLVPHLERARDRVAQHQHALQTQLLGELERSAGEPAAWSRRFRESIELLCGQRELHLPAPTMYYYPGLPAIPFFDREPFPWLAALEAATPAIREELRGLLGERQQRFTPYLQSDPTRPLLNRTPLLDNTDWGACFLFKDGQVVAENAARCPHTMAALTHVPLVQVPGRSPNVLFSRLAPGAHIEPHHGFVNTRLIGHLPLIVPLGCRFRVGAEARPWVEARAWLFDDTIEHEAWNDSAHERVVLIFEVWRPELSSAEQDQVRALFAAIGKRPGGIAGWGI
jgi:aspartate beta-hydroxylase